MRAGIVSCTMKNNVFSGAAIPNNKKRKCAFGRSLSKDVNLSPVSVSGESTGVWKKLGAGTCLLYTSPSPRDLSTSRMPSSA